MAFETIFTVSFRSHTTVCVLQCVCLSHSVSQSLGFVYFQCFVHSPIVCSRHHIQCTMHSASNMNKCTNGYWFNEPFKSCVSIFMWKHCVPIEFPYEIIDNYFSFFPKPTTNFYFEWMEKLNRKWILEMFSFSHSLLSWCMAIEKASSFEHIKCSWRERERKRLSVDEIENVCHPYDKSDTTM